MICNEFDLCDKCEADDLVFNLHANGSHIFAKIRDSSMLNANNLAKYKQIAEKIPRNFMHDSFQFHKSKNYERLRKNPIALELIKDMLRLENKFRLSEEYLSQYAESQKDSWKTHVTDLIQKRVVHHFLSRAEETGIYTDVESGLDFLHGAVGTFPEHLSELMECANYVKYTQGCKRGHLRVGDYVDGSKFPLYDPLTMKKELLSDYYSPERPTVIIASSYT